MRVILFQPDNAPNFCFEVMPVNSRGKLYADNPRNKALGRLRSVFIQSNREYASLARTFGWDISTVGPQWYDEDKAELMPNKERATYEKQCYCKHEETDGTMDCKQCGVMVGDFLSAAYNYLIESTGKIVDDPGYFDESEG